MSFRTPGRLAGIAALVLLLALLLFDLARVALTVSGRIGPGVRLNNLLHDLALAVASVLLLLCLILAGATCRRFRWWLPALVVWFFPAAIGLIWITQTFDLYSWEELPLFGALAAVAGTLSAFAWPAGGLIGALGLAYFLPRARVMAVWWQVGGCLVAVAGAAVVWLHREWLYLMLWG